MDLNLVQNTEVFAQMGSDFKNLVGNIENNLSKQITDQGDVRAQLHF